MKKNNLFIFFIIFNFLVGCNFGDGNIKSSKTIFDTRTGDIGLILSNKETIKTKLMIEGINKDSKGVQAYDSKNKESAEFYNTKQAIKNGSKILLMHLISGVNNRSVDYAIKNNVKVLLLENKIRNPNISGLLAPDYNKAGNLLSKMIKEKIEKRKNPSFSILNSLYFMSSTKSPKAKFKKKSFEINWPESKSIEAHDAFYNKVITKAKLRSEIEENPKINLVIGDSVNIIEGITSYFTEKKSSKNLIERGILISGYGYNEFIKEEITKKNIIGVVDFQWDQMGKNSVIWAKSILNKTHHLLSPKIKEAINDGKLLIDPKIMN